MFIISGTLNSPPGDLKGSFCCLAFDDSLTAILELLLYLPIEQFIWMVVIGIAAVVECMWPKRSC